LWCSRSERSRRTRVSQRSRQHSRLELEVFKFSHFDFTHAVAVCRRVSMRSVPSLSAVGSGCNAASARSIAENCRLSGLACRETRCIRWSAMFQAGTARFHSRDTLGNEISRRDYRRPGNSLSLSDEPLDLLDKALSNGGRRHPGCMPGGEGICQAPGCISPMGQSHQR
jgi:hypothetical protein